MSNEDKLASLRHAGIPEEALKTTLHAQNRMDMREYITAKTYNTLSISCIRPSVAITVRKADLAAAQADLLFYLQAKEMLLSGMDVVCVQLADLHAYLFDEDRYSGPPGLAQVDASKSGVIAIAGFFDQGGFCPCYFSPQEVAYFSAWFRRLHYNGVKFLLNMRGIEPEARTWWPDSLLGYIRRNSVTSTVPAP